MMKRILTLLAALVMMMAVAAPAAGASYKQIMRKNSRGEQRFSFETFRADLLWAVVSLNAEMCEAMWQRETDITEKPAELESRVLKASQVRGTQFLVFMYAPEGTETFTTDPNSFWQMKLDQGEVEYFPSAIEEVEQTVIMSRLFPFTHKWAKVYLVTFDGDFQPPFTLRMVGESGKSAIKWK